MKQIKPFQKMKVCTKRPDTEHTFSILLQFQALHLTGPDLVGPLFSGVKSQGGSGLHLESRWRAGGGVLKDFCQTHGLVVGVMGGFGGDGEEEAGATVEVT